MTAKLAGTGLMAIAAMGLAACATGNVDDYVADSGLDSWHDQVDLATDPDMTDVDTAIEDTAADPLPDTAVDTAIDTAVDTYMDTPFDTAIDTAVDTLPDTAIDTVVDTYIDTPVDTYIDSAVDTAVDTPIDTYTDTAFDTAVDTPVDTSVDTAVDDVALDEVPVGCTLFGSDTFGYQGCWSTPAVLGCDDISSTGTFLIAADDDYARASLGFSFDFYGTAYTDVSVGTNGHVYFYDEYLGLGNVCLPGDPGYSGIVTFIAGYWTDLYQDSSMGRGVWIQTLGTAPDRRFVVQWRSDFCCSTMADGILLQIVLFESSSDIRVCYVDTSNGSSDDFGAYATSGIQENLARAIQFSCNTASLSPGLQLDYLHP